jgi:septal ring factor EnvC (AmiA/AmiB activator)
MPDEKDKKKEHPRELPKIDDFKGVLGWVQKQKEESKAEGKPWGWIVALIASIIVFVSLAIAAYTAWKKGREIAKLKHKIDVDEEKKKQAEADAKLKKQSLARAELEAKALELGTSIEVAKSDIKNLEEERKKLNRKIDRITSWEDLDNF